MTAAPGPQQPDEVVAGVLATLDGFCLGGACDGPDAPPEDMVTCRVCWAVIELRKLTPAQPVRDTGEGRR